MTSEVKIETEFIKLQDLLKFAGVTETGGKAKIIIQLGDVKVNGKVCMVRSRKILPGDTVTYRNNDYKVIGIEG